MTTDAIDRELLINALRGVADEMAVSLVRSAFSTIVRDHLDFSTAIFDREGQLVVQGTCLAVQLGALPFAMRAILSAFPEGLAPGDVVLTNDPFTGGGTHLPDFIVATPIFHGDQVVGHVLLLAHKLDVGGSSPGGISVGSSEVFQEGLRIPPSKLVDAGRESTLLLRLIETNVRVPDKVLGDLRGQLAALHAGRNRFDEVIERFGADEVVDGMASILDYSERMARAAISELPDGAVRAVDHIDGLLADGAAIELRVGVAIDGDHVIVDYRDMPAQVPLAINATLCNSYSVALFALRILVGQDVPVNDGFARALEVRSRPGTITDATFPAAVGSRGITQFRLWDVLAQAIGQLVPARSMAGGDGGFDILTFSGLRPSGEHFVVAEMLGGSWGARLDADGVDGISHPLVNMSNTPIEHLEAEHPLQITEYGFVPASFGRGEFRGGCAVRKGYEVRQDGVRFEVRGGRVDHLPHGIAGGGSGTPSSTILTRSDGTVESIATGRVVLLDIGDRVVHTVCGAAGAGDEDRRTRTAIERDRVAELDR